jgi:hypothetical protein
MAVHRAVRLHIGNRRQGAVHEIGKEIRHIRHVTRGDHRGIVRLISERIADIAVAAVEWVGGVPRGIEAAAIIFPGDLVGSEHVADAYLHGRRNHETRLHQPFRGEGGVDIDCLPILASPAHRLHGIGQRTQIIRDRGNARLARIGTIEPLRARGIEVECSSLRIGTIDIGRRGRRGMAQPVAEEQLICKAERLAVRTRAAEHWLVIIVAHRVRVGERFEEWRIAFLHVEKGHGLAGIMRRAARRRAVGRRNRRLEILQAARRVPLRHMLFVDGAIHLLDHLEILMDRVKASNGIDGPVIWNGPGGRLLTSVMRISGPSVKLKPVPPVPKRY